MTMDKFILIAEIAEYTEMGGGIEYYVCGDRQNLLATVNLLNKRWKDRLNLTCFEIRKEVKFKSVEVVTSYEIDE